MNSSKEDDLELSKNHTVISKNSHECIKSDQIQGYEIIEVDKFNKLNK